MKDSSANKITEPIWDEVDGFPCWGPRTYALAMKILHSSKLGFISLEDKQDIIQDFAVKNPTFEKFKGKAKFSTWLHSGLYNMACSSARDKKHLRQKKENRPIIISAEKRVGGDDADDGHRFIDEISKTADEYEIVDESLDYWSYQNPIEGPHSSLRYHMWAWKW